jgi:hypothetical protein
VLVVLSGDFNPMKTSKGRDERALRHAAGLGVLAAGYDRTGESTVEALI